ncbi:MAG: AbrB/MazE/SpoVT family DNA-binding domain-containing protein [Chlamydiae bacterium]|nr:AbrB/MazE/SpoVT family DNA-binding domain-containing protein [Chlamydiota bacterium]MBI3278000.1 AbrB/MazE/SpoVT family DNA-binding domain-containing protein [Chlamydiota bacterium]
MFITKITRNFQITIPAEIRKFFNLQVGSLLDFSRERHKIVLQQKRLIDEDQAWFWTKEWQKGEKEVEKDKKLNRIRSFKDVSEMKKHFKVFI